MRGLDPLAGFASQFCIESRPGYLKWIYGTHVVNNCNDFGVPGSARGEIAEIVPIGLLGPPGAQLSDTLGQPRTFASGW